MDSSVFDFEKSILINRDVKLTIKYRMANSADPDDMTLYESNFVWIYTVDI